MNGIHEVRGSIPLGSTNLKPYSSSIKLVIGIIGLAAKLRLQTPKPLHWERGRFRPHQVRIMRKS